MSGGLVGIGPKERILARIQHESCDCRHRGNHIAQAWIVRRHCHEEVTIARSRSRHLNTDAISTGRQMSASDFNRINGIGVRVCVLLADAVGAFVGARRGDLRLCNMKHGNASPPRD